MVAPHSPTSNEFAVQFISANNHRPAVTGAHIFTRHTPNCTLDTAQLVSCRGQTQSMAVTCAPMLIILSSYIITEFTFEIGRASCRERV